MSWNGTNPQGPNWQGDVSGSGDGGVGDLYILPDPPSIAENPSIGLQGRNEVPLPTKYLDLEVANLTATNLTADDITADNITTTNLTATNINGNPNFDASNWSLYPAISNVQGTLGVFSVPLYSISDFLNLTVANNITAQAGNIQAGLNVSAGVRVDAPLGSFNTVNAESVQVSVTNETAAVDIYGANLVAGNNALYVEGGTTLTGGGVIHGVTIGALQVAGADTNRIDVVPIGIDISTLATPISIASGVACSVAAGAVLSLAGGSYIQYNSDQHYFINTTSGNDFTDIYVGNIHAADGGSAPLRINDAARGVELANVNSMTMTTQLAGVLEWSNATIYAIGNKVRIAGNPVIYYNCVRANLDLIPNAPIPNWVTASNYLINNVVFSGGLVFICSANISGSTTPPAPVSDPNWTNLGFTTNNITQFWTVFTPSVANITGDDVSNITIGKITAPVDFVRLAGDGLIGNTGLEGIGNVNNLTLTTTLFPLWNGAINYADNAEVSYQDGNWISQFAGNQANTPLATLDNWNASGAYPAGAVRYYATNNNAYRCILSVFGVAMTPPPSDPTHWTVFQVGNNGEDVWYPTTAPVVSTIVGDKLSEITIGNQSFVNGNGEYLSIRNAAAGDPLDADQNAIISSAGGLGLAGGTGVSVIAATGDITTASLIGAVDILSIEQNILIQAQDPTNGVILITGGVGVGLEGGTTITLESQGNVDITAVAGTLTTLSTGATNITSSLDDVNITSTTGDITLTSAAATTITTSDTIGLTSFDAMTLTSTNDNVSLTAGALSKVIVNSTLDLTNKNVINANTITGQGALTLATTGTTNLNLSPATGGVIVGNKNLSMGTIYAITNCIGMSSDNALAFTANNGNVNLTATGSGNRILLNSDASMGNRTLFNFTGTNVGGIYGLTTQPLNLVGQQATPQITIKGSLTMWANATTQAPGNSISGITTLNGRNIFSYGNFYNTATQTLGAINTATRVVMNTSANNNLITLDTTTNIGRITFTNAGVYKVVWNAYLLHGAGGTAKSCIWIRLNGTDVAGSGKTENNDSQQNETNMTSSSLINATAGQYIEFFWASDSVNVPLTAVAASAPFPATPSFSCTIQIVG